MLVSHRYRFIFLKTRKTAGSSVEVAFEPYARPEGWTPPGGDITFATEEMESEAGIVGARTPEPKARATYWDHMPARQLRDRLPRKVWNDYFKFCTIRNPWDKTVSYFHFANKRLRDEDPEVVFARFRRWVAGDRHTKGRDRQIYWIGKRPAMDGYIRYHRLEQDTAAVAAHLGIEEPLEIGGIHTEFRNRDTSYMDYYDDASRRAVAEAYAKEIEYFRWTFDNSAEVALPSFKRTTPHFLRTLGGRLGFSNWRFS